MISELSIVIPCYNEEKRISNTLKLILCYCSLNIKKYEIIVVDDGSIDNTSIIVNRFTNFVNSKVRIIKHKENQGKGSAVKTGVLSAKYKYVLFTDADNSTPIEMIEKLYKFKDNYYLIIGSRNLKDSVVIKQKFIRRLSGKIFSKLVKLILKIPIEDTQCGFKLMKTNIAKKIFKLQQVQRFAFDAELIYLYNLLNLEIKEVPIEWHNDCNSKVNLKKDSWEMWKAIWKIKKNIYIL